MQAVPGALEFKVLGPMEVLRDGERLLRRASLQRRLLATLLAGSGGAVAADSLVDAVWEGAPPSDARSSLMVCVHRLRRSLGDPRRIVHRANGYRIRVSSEEFDAMAFGELSAAARKARSAGELERSASLFAAAARLWRGEPYAGLPAYGPVAQEALRLDEERVLMGQEWFEVELDLGARDPLGGEIEALARNHPFRERLTALRMLAMYRAGRQAEALQVFHESRMTLRDEMGIDPGALLQRLYEAVLRRDERLDTVSTASLDTVWTPLKRRRARTEVAARAVPRELPADVAGFTGREASMGDLEAMRLGRPEEGIPPAAVVVIAGMAGVGKTSAATHWAHRIAGEYPDGQLFVNLRGFSGDPMLRPIEALGSLLRSLGLDSDQIPTEPDEAAARLRTETMGKRVLLLLDNAASAEQVIPLLPGGSGSLVIVTSRNRLGDLLAQSGAAFLDLAPLAPDEAERLLKSLLRMPRSSDRPEVGVLARQCGYLPLALCIAAASLAGRRPSDLAEYTKRLEEGGQTSRLRVGDSPATALRATFDRSYKALPDESRAVFRLIGVVPLRSFAVEAVSVLADSSMEATERAVEYLLNANMIDRDSRGRLHLHDLIRDYADSLVGPRAPERVSALGRLFDWYVGMADAACAHRYPGRARLVHPHRPAGPLKIEDAEQAAVWLDGERGNLLSIARYAAEHGDGSVSWKLADILRSDAWAQLSGADFLALGHAALAGARKEGDLHGEAVAELGLSTAYRKANDFRESIRHAERTIDLARRIGWAAGQASALNNLTHACMATGRLRDAVGHVESALAMNRADGRLRAQSINLGELGMIRGALGDPRQERRLYLEGLELAERTGGTGLQKAHLCNLVEVSVELGLVGSAEKHLGQAMRLDEDTVKSERVAETAAYLYAAVGEYDAALGHAESALRRAEERGNRSDRVSRLTAVAMALNRIGRHEEAAETAGRALDEAGPDLRGKRLEALAERAVGRMETGEFEAARADSKAMLALALAGGYRIGEGLARNVAAEAAIRGGGPGGADQAQLALEIFRSAGHRPGESWSLWLLGTAARAAGDRAAAKRYWGQVAQVHLETRTPVPARFAMDAD